PHTLIVSSFLSQLLPRPPSPTLFPYTTLFRSPTHPVPHPRRRPGSRACATRSARSDRGSAALGRHSALRRPPAPPARPPRPSPRDRKSTRLNSSHVSISYAVFCLKKKK